MDIRPRVAFSRQGGHNEYALMEVQPAVSRDLYHWHRRGDPEAATWSRQPVQLAVAARDAVLYAFCLSRVIIFPTPWGHEDSPPPLLDNKRAAERGRGVRGEGD